MGTVERRQRAREAVRQSLLKTAWELFSTLEGQDVTMRLIAEKAEYSPRTLYLYFEDKEALVEAIVDEAYRRTLRALDGSGLEGEPSSLLRTVVVRHVQEGLARPRLYETIFHHLWRPGLVAGVHRQEVERRLEALFLAAGASHEVLYLMPLLLRSFTLKLIHEGFQADSSEVTEKTEDFCRFLLRGLGIPVA